ncbi:MAG: hypothetical protein HY779_05330 [Rubrobacteridae bacterium]|nr:hypothetical protein [Rubrobacteridae bacterium]
MRIGRKLVVSYSLLALFILLVMVVSIRSAVIYMYSETLQSTTSKNVLSIVDKPLR